MLCLSRRFGEKIFIIDDEYGHEISVKVVKKSGYNGVSLLIVAPEKFSIKREELMHPIMQTTICKSIVYFASYRKHWVGEIKDLCSMLSLSNNCLKDLDYYDLKIGLVELSTFFKEINYFVDINIKDEHVEITLKN